jgi:maltose phosphorylase
MRVREDQLQFSPFLPAKWTSFSFKVGFRGVLLQVQVNQQGVQISNQSDKALTVAVYGQPYAIPARGQILAVPEYAGPGGDR